jgi:hypothetical protein
VKKNYSINIQRDINMKEALGPLFYFVPLYL